MESQERNRQQEAKVEEYVNIASDGSAQNGHGTYGWAKETVEGDLWEGSGEVVGNPGDMHAFRTEVQGAAEAVLSTEARSLEKAMVYIDKKGVVQCITMQHTLHPLQVEWELLEHTRKYVNHHKIVVVHIKVTKTSKTRLHHGRHTSTIKWTGWKLRHTERRENRGEYRRGTEPDSILQEAR